MRAPPRTPAGRREPARRRAAGGRRSAWEQVWAVVRAVPRGRVTTYGAISRALGERLSARAVGWALHACPAEVPWQRVVNAAGGVSTDRLPDTPEGLQRALLESEGVRFGRDGRVDLERYGVEPRQRRRRRLSPRT